MNKPYCSAMLVVLIMAFSCPAWAVVSGPCANCHTMHNSQGGASMASGDPSPDEGFATLLTNDCLGCHTGTNDGSNTIPYVYSTSAPTYEGVGRNTLAGGNFYWVAQTNGDAKGHNVFLDEVDVALSAGAPGNINSCAAPNDCHTSLATVYEGGGTLDGRYGCTGCHMVGSDTTKGFHHADDSNTVVGDGSPDTDGYYRFLSGHVTGANYGVSGIEDSDWEYEADANNHNEYLGHVGDHASNWESLSHKTMTAFCCGCHGNFHEQNTGSGWVRHPSDAVIEDKGEYANAFGGSHTYDPTVPVARSSLSGVTPSTVTLDADMVMCLSCHRPHGSPYDDMLRWDYNGMVAGGGGDDGEGCFKCHTAKDD